MAVSKEEGGLGLREFRSWNVADILRHFWNLICRGGSLWVAWIMEYIIKQQTIWSVSAEIGCWVWKKIIKTQDTVRTHVTYTDEEEPLWDGETMLKYKVRKVWLSLRMNIQSVDWYKIIWGNPLISRNSVVASLIIKDRITTREVMAKWSVVIDLNCLLCDRGIDVKNHIFAECGFIRQITDCCLPGLKTYDNWDDAFSAVIEQCDGSWESRVTNVTWTTIVSEVWRERCRRHFGMGIRSVKVVSDNIKEDIASCLYKFRVKG
ncbi:hypothetical protein LINPERHAP1_LOCUS19406 [Linum perenne]